MSYVPTLTIVLALERARDALIEAFSRCGFMNADRLEYRDVWHPLQAAIDEAQGEAEIKCGSGYGHAAWGAGAVGAYAAIDQYASVLRVAALEQAIVAGAQEAIRIRGYMCHRNDLAKRLMSEMLVELAARPKNSGAEEAT